MDRFAAMAVFRRVVETGGFSAAARVLGLSNAAVSKQVRQLEDHLTIRLLQRTTRQVSLTDAGRAYYERCVELLDALNDTEASIRDLGGHPAGQLRVNAPVDFAICRLSAPLTRFATDHPGVTLDLSLSDRLIDPIEHGFDLTIRVTPAHTDSSLVRRRLGVDALRLVAAPAYLDRAGRPESIADLGGHRALAYTVPGPHDDWRLTPPGDREVATIRVTPSLRADNGMLLRGAARAGLGVALLPDFLVAEDLATAALVTVLPNHDHGLLEIAAVSAPGRRLSATVRTMIDYISRDLRPLSGSASEGDR